MRRMAIVAGVGMIKFEKPGASDPYDVMAERAAREALADAGLPYRDIRQVYAGHVYGDSTSGQRAIYRVGMTGIPVINVNNNCATGSTALFLARQAVESGAAECVLAVGFEQMRPGALGVLWTDRPSPLEEFDRVTDALLGETKIPVALKYFAGAGARYMEKYGASLDLFAKVRAKASRHAANNPLSLLNRVLSEAEVLQSAEVWPGVLTRLMACPPTCGAAAAVLVSSDFARRRGLRTDVAIAAQTMTTDTPRSLDTRDMIEVVGYSMSRTAAQSAYEAAGIGAKDVDVVELHDCFAQNEVLSYEALGLCEEGGAEAFVRQGGNTYGGQVVTNPSGGLLSKGHPLGATGLAQCFELTHQLRGSAGKRQVDHARWALQHNQGLGGACVVTVYRAGD